MVEVEVGEGLLARVGVEALCEQMALELRRQRMCDAGCELRRHRVCGGRDRAGHDAIHRQCARILSRARVPQVYHEEQECKIRQGGHQGGEEWLWWGYGGAHLLSDDREGARVPRGRECVADDGEWHGREAQAEAHRNCGDDAADFRLGREVSVTDGRHPATHKCTRKAKARPRQGHTQVYTRKGRRVSTGVITQCDTTGRLSAEATQLSTHGRVPGACRRRELRVCNSARSESLWGGRRGSACAGGGRATGSRVVYGWWCGACGRCAHVTSIIHQASRRVVTRPLWPWYSLSGGTYSKAYTIPPTKVSITTRR